MRTKENLKNMSSRAMPREWIWCGLVLLLATCTASAGKVIYVDDDAVGANNGSSWTDAYNYLQDALAVASAGDEIRVAQGIYQPDLGGDNTAGDRRGTFYLKSGVTVKGGYAGFSEADPNVVDVNLYKSILSGDLNGDDVEIEPNDLYLTKVFDIPTRKDNSYYVVTGNNVDETAVLNGFTITSGLCSFEYSDSNLYAHGGAAIRIESGRPQILNCRITDNYARFGAVLNNDSNSTFVGCILSKNYVSNIVNISGNPVFTNCIFEQSEYGMENHDGSNPMLTNCIFEEQSWAGMENRDGSSPVLTNCVFRENECGMENRSSGSKAVLNNCRFINDGGISNLGDNSLILVDCIFSNSGGIDCSFDGNLILNNCLFENGWVGISARRCSLTLSNCIFSGNSGWKGCGIESIVSDLVLYNCKFIGNVAETTGGGINCAGGSIRLYGCVFSGNSAGHGGAGIDAGWGTVMLYNCTLSGNTTEHWAGGGIYYSGSRNNMTLTNCILWGNTPNQIKGEASVSYSNIQGGLPGEGNIDIDPLFADPANGDYHLKSQAGRWDPVSQAWIQDDVTSPCIDTGDPRSALSEEPEPNGGRINMGAYGGTPEASLSYIAN